MNRFERWLYDNDILIIGALICSVAAMAATIVGLIGLLIER